MQIGTLVKIKEEFEYQHDGSWVGLLGIVVAIKSNRVKITWHDGGSQAWHNPTTLEALCK
mgnify:CR=1 FL=1|tara:strand:- start:444 stop:623 length:180 start_codon:yes stop_codon:yes gene_type:complete